MIEITNQNLFAKAIADALAAINSNQSINTFEKTRWINAITKGVLDIENRGEFMEMLDTGVLVYWSESNNVYEANGICQCKAYENNQPCRHRAAAKLLKNYFALLENASSAPAAIFCPKCSKREINQSGLCDICESNAAPYFKITPAAKKVERIGGIRI